MCECLGKQRLLRIIGKILVISVKQLIFDIFESFFRISTNLGYHKTEKRCVKLSELIVTLVERDF